MLFCKDCKYHSRTIHLSIQDWCFHPQNLEDYDPVDGRRSTKKFPNALRAPNAKCGPNANWYKRKWWKIWLKS